jgi:hypothetical protein
MKGVVLVLPEGTPRYRQTCSSVEEVDGGLCRFFFSALCLGGGVRHELSLVDGSTGLGCMLRHAFTTALDGGRLARVLHLPDSRGRVRWWSDPGC